MAWKVPTHMPRRAAAGELLDALAHLAGGLVGEGDGEDAIGPHAAAQQLGDAEGDDARLARAGAGEDEQRSARCSTASRWAGLRSSTPLTPSL